MQLLEDINIHGVSVDVLGFEEDQLVLVISNKSDKILTSLEGSRYISTEEGVLELDSTKPLDMMYQSIGVYIPTDSFIVIKMDFGQSIKIKDGDRLELKMFNIVDMTIIYKLGKWYVIEYENNQNLCEYLLSKCVRFEALEDKVGISIQNISFNIDNGRITPSCEIVSTDVDSPFFDFAIEFAAYNNSNELLAFKSLSKDKSDFMGFEIFCFGAMKRNINIKDISRILFYPVKK